MEHRATAGFTLVEMLAAVAILMLLTAMIAMGVTVGMNTYRQSTFESNSQMLQSTVDNALADPFRFARSGINDQGGLQYTITYQDDAAQTITVTGNSLVVKDGYLYLEGTTTTGDTLDIKVLNAGAYGQLRISDEDLVLDLPGTTDDANEPNDESMSACFRGYYTIYSPDTPSLTKRCSFCFMPLGNDISKVTS